jgi:hypothetical protein
MRATLGARCYDFKLIVSSCVFGYHAGSVFSNWSQACSQWRHASAQARQCSCISACCSHSAAQRAHDVWHAVTWVRITSQFGPVCRIKTCPVVWQISAQSTSIKMQLARSCRCSSARQASAQAVQAVAQAIHASIHCITSARGRCAGSGCALSIICRVCSTVAFDPAFALTLRAGTWLSVIVYPLFSRYRELMGLTPRP